MDGYGRRDVNGKANAGLTLGIIGTALGAWALFGNRRSAGVLGTGAGLMGDGSTNINVVGAGMGSAGAPTAFQAWSKSCEDTLALQGGLYQWALTQQNQRFQDHDVRARSRRDRMYERINDFLARGGRGRSGRGGRGRGMMNRIGYRTYDNYEGDEHRGYDEHHRGYDDDERMLLMRMLGVGEDERYEYGDEHFNKQEAKQTVDEMYHVKDGKKYIGEKYDMQKAHEVCNKFKDKLEEDIEVADVYVAINAQYHDYCKLFEKWFGKGNFDDMIFESAIDFWFDDVDFGEDKLWKYFNELK